MNKLILELIFKILDSDLPIGTKTEIVKWYTLPRTTGLKGLIEIPDEPEEDLGTVKRPTGHDLKRKDNPKFAETEDAMKETFDAKMKENNG